MNIEVDLIEKNFKIISDKIDEVTAFFYNDLLSSHPEIKPLFQNVDMEHQQKKLGNMLALIVSNIRNMGFLIPNLHELGEKHIKYKVLEHQYEWVEEALLKSFKYVSGAHWNERVEQAWKVAIKLVSTEMKIGAANANKSDHN